MALPRWVQVFAVIALGGAGIVLYRRGQKSSGRRFLGDPKRIARESVTVEEYARRAEAWNASEAKPMSLTMLAKFWAGGRQSAQVMRALRNAREERLEQRERMWSRMSKGLKGAR